MKKVLIWITIIVLILLCSCDNKSEHGDASQSPNDNADIRSDATASANSSETSPMTLSETTSITSIDIVEMPDQSFIGVWATDESKTDEILIYEITENSVKFNTGVYRYFGFTATGILSDGEIVFGDGISSDYHGPYGIKGRLLFSENSITVIYDDFGDIDYPENWPNSYTFTVKDENSNAIVNQFISNNKSELS